ncbi:MAG: hypothetical protein HUK04_04180 [Bacteroidaceae bacterium]|nr:hypothetical protein [Bacteroidaceae bacterium]
MAEKIADMDFREVARWMSDKTLATLRSGSPEFQAFEAAAMEAVRSMPPGTSMRTQTKDPLLQPWFLKILVDFVFNRRGYMEGYTLSEDYRLLIRDKTPNTKSS